MYRFYEKNKIGTVIKHIPGLGLSKCDSHYKTPIIKANKKELIKKDFKPFKACKSLFAMTAHAFIQNMILIILLLILKLLLIKLYVII